MCGDLGDDYVGTPPRRRGGRGVGEAGPEAVRNTPASAGRTRQARARWRRDTEHPRVGGEDCQYSGGRSPNSGTPPRRRGGHAGTAGRDHRHLEHPRVGGEDSSARAGRPSSSGTPPRRRGGRPDARPEDPDRRNTPASAGRTPALSTRITPPSEHPRVGGEDAAFLAVRALGHGTPPRRRGGPAPPGRPDAQHRNTPASAGRTSATLSRASARAEHPRVGGEDFAARPREDDPVGTPPRRRGGRSSRVAGRLGERNTPASAGRTTSTTKTSTPPTEHPRVGGEDLGPGGLPHRSAGTPPRRRGGLQTLRPPAHGYRNTPASAGRTPPWSGSCSSRTEHPRVGGEDEAADFNSFSLSGTPPRRRGGRDGVDVPALVGRNTPASAGRTRSSPSWAPTSAEHPRVGGEDALEAAQKRKKVGTPPRRRGGPPRRTPQTRPRRNTPASAGRTTSASARPRVVSEHPRVGGEDLLLRFDDLLAAGTPPRRRGGRRRHHHHRHRHRNTPASAGRTTTWPTAATTLSRCRRC